MENNPQWNIVITCTLFIYFYK